MADIAEYDKNKMKNMALIHTLENEMLHKFKELSGAAGRQSRAEADCR